VDCRSPRSVTACIQTEYATDTENPPVCGGSFQHSFLGPCANGGSRASSRETPGSTHVAPSGSPTVDLEIRDSVSTICIPCHRHSQTTLQRLQPNSSDIWPDFPANLPLFPETILETSPNVLKDLTMLFLGRNPHPTFLYFQDGLQKLLQMSSKISPCPFWDQIPAQPSSISPRSFRDLPKSCRKRQSPTRPDSWEKAWGKLGGGCGDYSWRNGKLAKWRKLVATKSAPTAREEKL